jgi:hypothetical protein
MMLILDWCLFEPRYGGCRELKTTGVALKLGTGMVFGDETAMVRGWTKNECTMDE